MTSIIRDAFAQASKELGEIQIKGRGHAPRIVIGNAAASRYAAEGTDNWIWHQPGKEVGTRRYFPDKVVLRAATLAKFEIIEKEEEIPIYQTEEIPYEAAWREGQGNSRTLRENVIEYRGKYLWKSELTEYKILKKWYCPKLQAEGYLDTTTRVLETPIPTGERPQAQVVKRVDPQQKNPQCDECRFLHLEEESIWLDKEIRFCAVKPTFLIGNQNCPEFLEKGEP